MIGVFTEKPSAKRNFAKALGGEIGEFNGESYLIVNAAGHLFSLLDPDKQVNEGLVSRYKSWSISNLPWSHNDINWKYKCSDRKLVDNIKKALIKCDEIVIATDIDPSGEGDLIAAEILLHIKLQNKKISRMYFTDESVESIQQAFIGRKEINLLNNYDYQKGLFRAKWDYMSMQFTRVVTNYSPIRAVLRQGRLKSVMVSFVGGALEELDKYEKIPFYQNRFRDENGIVYTSTKEEKYKNVKDVPNKYSESAVILDSEERKSTIPPKLLDLAKLSSILASKGYSAREVLSTYQKMYENQILSYPRTSDKNITSGQFNEMLPYIDKIADLVGCDRSKLTHRTPRKTHVQDKGSHGANRPGINIPNNLNDLNKFGRSAKMIYKILAQNFLAMFAEDFEYLQQKGHLEKYPDFKGSVSISLVLGWKEIFNIDEEEIFNKVGLGKIAKPFIYEGYPPKPPTPTMKWLMNKLDKNNVGTGATRTSTYSEVTNQNTKYPLLIDIKGKITMTDYGRLSYLLTKGTQISKVETTESVFNVIDEIGKGNLSLIENTLANLGNIVLSDIEIVKENAKHLDFKKVYEKKEKMEAVIDGKKISFNKKWGDYEFNLEELERLSLGETIKIQKIPGKDYVVKGRLEKQKYKGKEFYGFKVLEFLKKKGV